MRISSTTLQTEYTRTTVVYYIMSWINNAFYLLLLYHLSLPQHCCFSILFVIVSFLAQGHYYSYLLYWVLWCGCIHQSSHVYRGGGEGSERWGRCVLWIHSSSYLCLVDQLLHSNLGQQLFVTATSASIHVQHYVSIQTNSHHWCQVTILTITVTILVV